MNTTYILVCLIVMIIIFATRNILMMRNLNASKGYRIIYRKVIENDPNVISDIEEYIKNEKNDYLLAKTYILLLYIKLLKNDYVDEVLDKLDLNKVFIKGNKYDKKFVNTNADMMIWIICCLVRLYKEHKLNIIKEKMDLLKDKLENHVEFKVFYGACAVLDGKIDESLFLNKLVNGEYSNLDYDKQLIAVTKRLALAFIAYQNKEKKNIEYAEELKILSQSMLGKNLLLDLDIYEVYK